MIRVLLVEDDPILNCTVAKFLRSRGMTVTPLYDGLKAVELIDKEIFDLFIVDINVPGVNGLELVAYIRKRDVNSPVIIVTASMELDNFKVAYGNGCSEYIRKPFYLEELNIRIQKLMEKSTVNHAVMSLTGSVSYCVDSNELSVDGEIRRLRKKEGRLLYLLLKNANKTLAREVIESYVWENEIKDSYPLRQLVNELRGQLGESGVFIRMERGIGYRLEIEV